MNLTDRNVFCNSNAWKNFCTTIFPVCATTKLQNCNFTWCVAIFFCTWKITKPLTPEADKTAWLIYLQDPLDRAGQAGFDRMAQSNLNSAVWNVLWACTGTSNDSVLKLVQIILNLTFTGEEKHTYGLPKIRKFMYICHHNPKHAINLL